ncbi:hypothetical protein HNP29_002646 [Pseudomonas alcaligenes]|nr:hypothetical protein [Pseudomonas alcaligenes]
MGPKQDQKVDGGGTAIQATGDVHVEHHYHGLPLSEVRELTELFLQRQLPALRAEAMKVMEENTQKFVELVAARLAVNEKVTQEAFSKPDAQVSFNEALKGSAEKGDQIDLDMLADMVIGRLEADAEPMLKLVYEDAIRVLPRLTGAQVAFLGYVAWMRYVTHVGITEIGALENFTTQAFAVVEDGLRLSVGSREYLVSLGLITINHVADADNSLPLLRDKYPFLPQTKDEIAQRMPAMLRFIDPWSELSTSMCFLSATGKLIGLLILQKAYGKFDLSKFIN